MRILEGIRVIDLSSAVLGPVAANMLASIGAEVIHIEPPDRGDWIRGLSSFFGISLMLPGGKSVVFENCNWNKKSLAIDFTKPEGLEIIKRLVGQSDVLVTNMRIATLRKHKLDYDSLKEINPRLVYASANAFGHRGPDKDLPGLEGTGYARSGAMMSSGEEGMPPIYLSTGIGDYAGAVFLAYGVIAALLARERLGMGQEVRTSQLGAMVYLQGTSMATRLLTGRAIPRQPRDKAQNPAVNLYECADGRWIFLANPREDSWPTLCRATGRPDLLADPRFEDASKRAINCKALYSIMRDIFLTKSLQEWGDLFTRAGLIFSPCNTIDDVVNDPQVLENQYIIDFDHHALGRVKFLGFPIEWSKTPARMESAAPEVGQNTEEVLTQVCGLSWEEIEELRKKQVI